MAPFNPFSGEFKADPYAVYAELRRDQPVARTEPLGFYAVSRHDDVSFVLKNPQLFSSSAMGAATMLGGGQGMMRSATVISTDPPDHTRLRNVVNRAFTPRMVADLEPRIRELTTELLDRVAPSGQMDLTRDLAIPLPVIVIAEILGVEPERYEDFKRWSDDVVLLMSGSVSESEREALRADLEALTRIHRRAGPERRSNELSGAPLNWENGGDEPHQRPAEEHLIDAIIAHARPGWCGL